MGGGIALVAACASSKTDVSTGPHGSASALKPAPAEKCDIEKRSPLELEQGCEQGDESSCACLVDLFLLKLSAPKMVDYAFSQKGIRLISAWWASTREDYVDACHAGSGEACANAFGMWLAKEFKSYSEPKAFELMEKGCSLNHAESCSFLGSAWRDGYPGAPAKDAQKSYAAFKKACELGHADSCSEVNQ